MIYTPFYVTGFLGPLIRNAGEAESTTLAVVMGPHIDTPFLGSVEILGEYFGEESREICPEKYRRISTKKGINVVFLTIPGDSGFWRSRWNAGLRGKSVENHGDISE